MAINKKFIHFNKREDFDKELAAGNILTTSIVFIKDTKEVWTHQWGIKSIPEGGSANDILVIDSEGNTKWADPAEVSNILKSELSKEFVTSKLAATKYQPIGDYVTKTEFETLEFTVETLNTGLGEVEKRLDEDEKLLLPEGWEDGQVLTVKDGKPTWGNMGLLDLLTYGVAWTRAQADPHLTRVGNLSLHKTLPIQSGMRGCIVQPKNNKVMYYLDAQDWSKKADGTPSRLDGYDGEVMIEVPGFYIKSFIDGDNREVRISPTFIDETWTYQPTFYVAAYRDTVLNSVPEDMGYLSTLPANSAVSVVNTESYCRGGGNNAAYDSYLADTPCRSQLGKPRTNSSRANFRTWCRNGGKEMLSYTQYKNVMYWLYVIEYANFNCQEAYNAELTSEGYRQGGLGEGVTTINGTYWNAYWGNSGYYPLTPCGYCNEFGNGTGIKNMEVITPTENGGEPTQVYNFKVPRWRGIDNPFGDIWTNVDGIIIDADADNHENNMNYVYACDDPSKYADSLNDGYVKIGEEIHTDGYTKWFDLGEAAHIIPEAIGAGATTYKCDYHWTGSKNTTLRTLLLGGGADSGAYAGLGCFNSDHGVGSAATAVGFRSALVIS